MRFKFFLGISVFCGLMGCTHVNRQIVNRTYIDSLIQHYQEPAFARSNDSSMLFWRHRIDPRLTGIVSESKYAGTLSMRFHLFGDIQDIKKADSVIQKLDSN